MIKPFFALVFALLATLAHASDTKQPDADNSNSITEFFKKLNQYQGTFAEYRFLKSPAVQGSPETRHLAAQMLATDLSFLGRPNDALRAFPVRKDDRPLGENELPAPTTAAYKTVPAVDWITSQASDYRVIMLNEAHHAPQTRVLTFALLQALRDQGFDYLAVETLVNNGNNPLAKGYPTSGTGSYSREPIFAELLREAKRLGYTLLPYETNAARSEETQQQRETGQAQAIADCLASSPDARILVHAGYGHIGEREYGMPDGARPMAMELTRINGLPILTVDQTSARSYELDDIKTLGRQLSVAFVVAQPAVLLEKDSGKPWSNKSGVYDASVLLSATSSSSLRPDWLSIGGRRQAVSVDMTRCLDHLPCLVEARHAEEGDDAIPADQFMMLSENETSTPLYLAPGHYRLRLLGKDGIPLTERELSVPAETSGTLQTTAFR